MRRAITAINSEITIREKLISVIRGTSRALGCGVSFLLLDSTGKTLIHTQSWGLPKAYLLKGMLDAEVSLEQKPNEEEVIITNIGKDKCVQYPDQAKAAGIDTIMAIRVKHQDKTIGSLRVYADPSKTFSNQDISFCQAMANLISIAFSLEKQKPEMEESNSLISSVREVLKPEQFAHPSEKEFTEILDFYNIEWVYEPRSFLLVKKEGRIVEMFTPDFFLPSLNLYIELTTLKQGQVTRKNQKLKRLRQLYPDINIALLYRKDYEKLLAKYSRGPLADTRARDIERILYSANVIKSRVHEIAGRVSNDYKNLKPVLVGVQRGFICFMADLIRQISIPLDIDFMAISYYGQSSGSGAKITKDLDLDIASRHIILIEDIIDTGITLNFLLTHLKSKNPASINICTLLDRKTRRLIDIEIRYTGFEVPDEFVVGYGLDYHEEYRNLPFIGIPMLARDGIETVSSAKMAQKSSR
jgi:hypoxanthine phosphoribosyltransferase